MKRGEKSQASAKPSTALSYKPTQVVNLPGDDLFDDDSDLEALLDDIGRIPTGLALSSRLPTNQVENRTMDNISSSSSELFDDEIMALPSPPAELFHFTPEVQVADNPLNTIATRSRPLVGVTPAAIKHTTDVQRPEQNILPFPVAPDCLTTEIFLRNFNALKPKIESAHQKVPLSSVSSTDRLSKVPLVVAMVASVEQPTGTDYLVKLTDETGSILATVHEDALKDRRQKFHYGMMLVLSDLSIFRPNQKAQCLVVVKRNIQTIFYNCIIPD